MKLFSFLVVFFSFFLLVKVVHGEEAIKGREVSEKWKTNFPIPLPFSLGSTGTEVLPPVFEYDLVNPQQISLGGHNYSTNFVDIKLSYLTKDILQSKNIVFSNEVKGKFGSVLSFVWPREILPYGKVELVTNKGKIVMESQVQENDVEQWKVFIKTGIWKSGTDEITKTRSSEMEEIFKDHIESSFGFLGVDYTRTLLAKVKDPFQFCIKGVRKEDAKVFFCSHLYRSVVKDGQVLLVVDDEKYIPKVKINEQESVSSGKIVGDKEFLFYGFLSNGTYFQFDSKAKVPVFTEVYFPDENNKNVVEILGVGDNFPTENTTVTRAKADNFWDPTIGDFRAKWKLHLSLTDPFTLVKGERDFLYKYEFVLRNLPNMDQRSYLHKNTPTGTYKNSIKLHGYTPQGIKVSSKQKSLKNSRRGEWTWEYAAPKQGYNTSVIELESGKKNWTSGYELYHGHQYELGARLTALASSSKVALLSDFRILAWAEDLFGMESYYFSRQRWGFEIKKGQSFASADVGDSGSQDMSQDQLNASIMYRFTPGLWGRDPFWGAIMEYNAAKIGSYDGSMLGVGLTWARSMPYYIDKIFDVPFAAMGLGKREKWVNAQFIYYVMGTNKDVKVEPSYSADFHGVLNWTPSFFVEGGFGFKRIIFTNEAYHKKISILEGYGTFGVGYTF